MGRSFTLLGDETDLAELRRLEVNSSASSGLLLTALPRLLGMMLNEHCNFEVMQFAQGSAPSHLTLRRLQTSYHHVSDLRV